jgi:thiamine transport system permease protein
LSYANRNWNRNHVENKSSGSSIFTLVSIGVVGIFFSVFYFFPLGKLLRYGLSISTLIDVYGSAGIWKIIWFTFWQAALSTLLSLLLGTFIANTVTRLRFRGRSFLRVLSTIPFVLPTVVVSSSFISVNKLFRLDGTSFSLEASALGIIIAHAFFNTAIVVRTVGSWWSQLKDEPEYAARTLGSGPVKTFMYVTLPRLKPALLASASLTFLFSFTSFGVILLLGGLRKSTIETEIWRYATQRTDIKTAAALGIAQLVIVISMLLVNGNLRARHATNELGASFSPHTEPLNPRSHIYRIASGVFLIVSFFGLPLLLLFERSIKTTAGYSLVYYKQIFTGNQSDRFKVFATKEAIWNSITWALIAMFVATVLGYLAANLMTNSSKRLSKTSDTLLLLPLGTSGVLIGFGILIALNTTPVDFRSKWWIVPLAQAMIGVGFVARIVATAIRGIDPQLKEAAKILGASKNQVWRTIDLPIVSRSLLAGAAFSFAIAIGEFGATAFLTRPQRPTIPTTIFNLLGRPGAETFGMAMALSVILAVATGLSIAILDRTGSVISRDT